VKKTPRLLVVDDEQAICTAFRRFFEPRGWSVGVAATAANGLARYREQRPDIVFLDVRLPDGSGLDLLGQLQALDPAARIVVITAHGTLDVVAGAVRGKALDVLVKPFELDRAFELAAAVAEPAPLPASAATVAEAGNPLGIVGAAPAMRELYRQLAFIAAAEGTVLVTGETGTGKELVVRALHEYSRRRDGPFVAVNCGALPEPLVESELFGHVRGAFTGAATDRPGRFEQADGGTLFLDEIGDLPLSAQVKLLRVLDSGVLERLGATQSVRVDVRVMAATNRDLEEDLATGGFRPDLYYRLAALRLRVPRLADRAEDILPLARHFLQRRTTPERPVPVLSAEAAAVLQAYAWPGNVRELKHVMEHAAVLAGGGPILATHLPLPTPQPAAATTTAGFEPVAAAYLAEHGHALGPLYRELVEQAEAAAIRYALERARGNQSEAAALLGIHRNTLRHRLRALGACRA